MIDESFWLLLVEFLWMLDVVARLTEADEIAVGESKQWMLSEMQDVMHLLCYVKASTNLDLAMLTLLMIPLKYLCPLEQPLLALVEFHYIPCENVLD